MPPLMFPMVNFGFFMEMGGEKKDGGEEQGRNHQT
jgi:hypothetical protein